MEDTVEAIIRQYCMENTESEEEFERLFKRSMEVYKESGPFVEDNFYTEIEADEGI